MRITVLGSGSKGNSIVVQHGNGAIMIDAGFKLDEMLQRMDKAYIALASIQALFITHGHCDHTAAIADLTRLAAIPVFMAEELFLSATGVSARPGSVAWLALNRDKAALFAIGDKLHVAGFEVTPIPVSHDSISPVGFIIEAEGMKLSIVTDAGEIPSQSKEAMANSDVIMLESNYDPAMLQNSQRTEILKARIAGPKGHLSNEKSAETISELLSDKTKDVVLLHLSMACNTPELATEAAFHRNPALRDGAVNLRIAGQDEPISICVGESAL